MDTRHIRAFLAIADTGSVTRAADLLHVVQPAISRQLKLLEEDIGARLFDRNRDGMALTEAGHTLLEYSRRALRELDNARFEIQPTADTIAGAVNIGLLPSSCELISAPLIAKMRELYPGIRVSLSVGYTDHLARWLETGEIDCALLYDPVLSPSISLEPLLKESLCLSGPRSIETGDMQQAGVEELGKFPLVLPSKPHGLRVLVDRTCAEVGIHTCVVAETNDLSVQRHLVLSGLGVTVLPRVAIRMELEKQLLWAVPIALPQFSRCIALALPTTRRITPALRCTVTELKACMMQAVLDEFWNDTEWLGAS